MLGQRTWLPVTSPEGQVVAKVLLEQAQQCWRLASSIYNQEIAAELEAYARQLEKRAASLKEEAGLSHSPTAKAARLSIPGAQLGH